MTFFFSIFRGIIQDDFSRISGIRFLGIAEELLSGRVCSVFLAVVLTRLPARMPAEFFVLILEQKGGENLDRSDITTERIAGLVTQTFP